MQDIQAHVESICRAAKEASRGYGSTSTAQKNALLCAMADQLTADTASILAANAEDLSAAAERQLLSDYSLPDLEVLIVGHHGSKYSTCTELLEATAPDAAIISVGAGNSYGHPAREVLERLEASGCVVYRTDLHGTIIYRG